MPRTRIFPCALICLDLCAAATYLWQRDWRQAIYWTAAAVLTTTVTF